MTKTFVHSVIHSEFKVVTYGTLSEYADIWNVFFIGTQLDIDGHVYALFETLSLTPEFLCVKIN